MKNVFVTFSISSETHRLLRSLVGQRKMSLFVAQAITQALQQRVECLKKDYMDANQDSVRKETIDDWRVIESEDWEQ